MRHQLDLLLRPALGASLLMAAALVACSPKTASPPRRVTTAQCGWAEREARALELQRRGLLDLAADQTRSADPACAAPPAALSTLRRRLLESLGEGEDGKATTEDSLERARTLLAEVASEATTSASDRERLRARARRMLERLFRARATYDALTSLQPMALAGGRTYWSATTLDGAAAVAVADWPSVAAPPALIALIDIDADAVIPSPAGAAAFVASMRGSSQPRVAFFASPFAGRVELAAERAYFAPDGGQLVLAGEGGVQVRDGGSGALQFKTGGCPQHGTPRFTAQGDFVMTADAPSDQSTGGLLLLDLTKHELTACESHSGSAISASGRFVASVGFANDSSNIRLKVRLFDREAKSERPILLEPISIAHVPAVSFDLQDRLVVTSKEPNAMGQHYVPEVVAVINPLTGKKLSKRAAGTIDDSDDWLRVAAPFMNVTKRPRKLLTTMRSLYYNHVAHAVSRDKNTLVLVDGVPTELLASNLELVFIDLGKKAVTRRVAIPSPEPRTVRVAFGPGDYLIVSTFDGREALAVNRVSGEVQPLPATDPITIQFDASGGVVRSAEGWLDLASGATLRMPTIEAGRAQSWLRSQSPGAPPPGVICRIGPVVVPIDLCPGR